MSRPRSTASRRSTRACSRHWRRRALRSREPSVPRLGAALATMDEPVVLVLDDLHLLDNPACLDAIAALARHVPEGSQLALSARGAARAAAGSAAGARPGARDRAGRAADGRGRGAPAAERRRPGPGGLPRSPSSPSTRRAGPRVSTWRRCRPRRAAAGIKGATAFRGDDRFVADYLRSELLSRLPRDELRFLTRTAVLERMSGPLCDAVLDASGSAATLESLARSNLFLVPLDRNGEWYRYHHLFQELLRSELERAEPDLVPRLLARAADWCEANGQPEAAIGYAQEAGDVDRRGAAGRAVSPSPRYQSGRVATVERWLGWLEAHGALERNAAVAVLGALTRRDLGPAGGGGALGRCGRARELRRHPARRQRFDRLVAGPPACAALSSRGGEDARRRGACGPDARPREPVPAERLAAARDLALAGRRGRRRPTTCSPTSPRRASSWGRRTPVRWRSASAPRSRSNEERGSRPRSSRDRALRVIRRSRMEEYPTSALAYCRGGSRRAPPRRRRARRGAPDPGAAPAAAAHVRAAVLRRPDPVGARAGLPDARRRGRRRDDAARDRRDPAPTTGPRRRSRPRRTSCAPA